MGVVSTEAFYPTNLFFLKKKKSGAQSAAFLKLGFPPTAKEAGTSPVFHRCDRLGRQHYSFSLLVSLGANYFTCLRNCLQRLYSSSTEMCT